MKNRVRELTFSTFKIPPFFSNIEQTREKNEGIGKLEENPFANEDEIPAFKNYLTNLIEHPIKNPNSLILPRFSTSVLFDLNIEYTVFNEKIRIHLNDGGVLKGNEQLWIMLFEYLGCKDLWRIGRTSRYSMILVASYMQANYFKYFRQLCPWYLLSPLRLHASIRTPNTLLTLQNTLLIQIKRGNVEYLKKARLMLIEYMEPLMKSVNSLLSNRKQPPITEREYISVIEKRILEMDENGMDSVLIACQEGYPEILKYLLQADVDITYNKYSLSGFNCLGCIVLLDNLDMFQSIILGMKHQKLNILNFSQEHNLFLISIKTKTYKLLETMIKTFGSEGVMTSMSMKVHFIEALCYAIKSRQQQLSQLFIKYIKPFEIDINNIKECKYTPLMIAAKYMNKDIAEILIKKIIEFKINLNIRNKKGKTALHYAAKKGCFQIVGNLLSNKADPNIMDIESRGAFYYSLVSGETDIIFNLLEYINYDNLAKFTSRGHTPLHLAQWKLSENQIRTISRKHKVLAQDMFILKKAAQDSKRKKKFKKPAEEVPIELLRLQYRLNKNFEAAKEKYAINISKLPKMIKRRLSLDLPMHRKDPKLTIPTLECRNHQKSAGITFMQPYKYGEFPGKVFLVSELRSFSLCRLMAIIKWNMVAEIRRMGSKHLNFQINKTQALEKAKAADNSHKYKFMFQNNNLDLPPGLKSISLDNADIPNRKRTQKRFMGSSTTNVKGGGECTRSIRKHLEIQKGYHKKLSQPVFGGSKAKFITKQNLEKVVKNLSTLEKAIIFLSKERGMWKEIIAEIIWERIKDIIHIDLGPLEDLAKAAQNENVDDLDLEEPTTNHKRSNRKLPVFSATEYGLEMRRKIEEQAIVENAAQSNKHIKFSAFTRDMKYLEDLKLKKQRKEELLSPMSKPKIVHRTHSPHKKVRACCVRKTVGPQEYAAESMASIWNNSEEEILKEKISSLQQMIKKQNERCKRLTKFLKVKHYQNFKPSKVRSKDLSGNIKPGMNMEYTQYNQFNQTTSGSIGVAGSSGSYGVHGSSGSFGVPRSSGSVTQINQFQKALYTTNTFQLMKMGRSRYIPSATALPRLGRPEGGHKLIRNMNSELILRKTTYLGGPINMNMGRSINRNMHPVPINRIVTKPLISPFQEIKRRPIIPPLDLNTDSPINKDYPPEIQSERVRQTEISIQSGIPNFVNDDLLYTKKKDNEIIFTTFPEKYDYFSRELKEMKEGTTNIGKMSNIGELHKKYARNKGVTNREQESSVSSSVSRLSPIHSQLKNVVPPTRELITTSPFMNPILHQKIQGTQIDDLYSNEDQEDDMQREGEIDYETMRSVSSECEQDPNVLYQDYYQDY